PATRYRAQILKIRTLKGPNYVQEPTWHDIDDPQGAFTLHVAGPGIYIVHVAADGFALNTSSQINTETAAAPVRIELSKGTPLLGVVVDEQGNPISGAKVSPPPAAGALNGKIYARGAPGEPVIDVVTGKFTMPQLPPGQSIIKVVHPN